MSIDTIKPLAGKDIATLTNVELVTELTRLLRENTALRAEIALSKPLYSRRQIEARVRSLEAALKPVADKYDSITPDAADVASGLATHPDNMQDEQLALITLKIGDLRRARTALASTGGEHHAE